MGFKLSDLAKHANASLKGDADCIIERISEISTAQPGEIAFLYHPKYAGFLDSTKASAVILKKEHLSACPVSALVTDDPRLAYTKIAILLYPPVLRPVGKSDEAFVANDAVVDKTASISEGSVILPGAIVNSGVQIGPGCVIEENVVIGRNTRINANATIGFNCVIGNDCIIHSGVVVGADGFGFVKDGENYIKIPQLGKVQIGNNVELGANTTIDRGALDDTVIGNGVKIDNQVQIAHGVSIGDNTVISAATAIAGSTHIGSSCLIGGLVGIIEHLTITDNVMITGRTMVTRSITQAGSYSSSTPMDTTENWRKNSARFRRLDDLAKRVARLEKTITDLE